MKTTITVSGTLLLLPILSILMVILIAPGCVERKLLIRSDPPGARVDLNREGFVEGETPLTVPFSWYGTYHVRMALDGYEEFEGTAAVKAPWWAITPFDLFTDVLLPFTFRDTWELTTRLEPIPDAASAEELRRRHEALKLRAEEVRRGVAESPEFTETESPEAESPEPESPEPESPEPEEQ